MKHLAISMVPAALLAMMATSAAGETAPTIRTPQLGSVFEEQSRQIRLIEGVVGAASLGRTVQIGAPVEQAWIASGAKRALVRLGGEAPRLALADWRNEVSVLGSDLLPANADVVAFSPSGSAFALLAAEKLQVWAIEAGQLNLLWSADTPDGTALAVDDGGSVVAAFGAGQVSLIQSSGRSFQLQTMESFGAMGFGLGSLQFAVADSASSKVTLFQNVLNGASGEIVWESAGERVSDLAFSGDNQRLAIASNFEQGGRVRIVGLDGLKQDVVDAPAQVLNLVRAHGNAVFQLSSWAKGTLYLIDADSSEPHLIVVPGVDEGVANE